jgi:general secretion pathway protein L
MVKVNLKDFYGQGCIGIQFTSQYLLLANLQRGLREVVLKDYQIIPLDTFRDDNKTVALEIRSFAARDRFLSDNYVLGVPRERTIARYIDLPAAVEENLSQVIHYELEKYIPFTSEELYFDYQIIERDAERNLLRVLLVAMKKDYLEYYLDILKEAQIDPTIAEISSNALLNTILFNYSGLDKDLRAIINLEDSALEFLLVQGKTLKYSRVATLIGDIAHPLARELEYACWEEGRHGFNNSIKELIINNGRVEDTDNLLQTIQEATGIETSASEPFKKIKALPRVRSTLPDNLASPVGLGLRGLDRGWSKINLLPIELRKKRRKGGLLTTLILIGLIFLLGITSLSTNLIKERRDLRRLEDNIADLKTQVSFIEQKQKEADEITKELRFFDAAKNSQPRKLEILKELTGILPNDAWLTNLAFDENRVVINGFASSASSLIPILDNSSLFQNVEFASPITKGMNSSERFKIKLEIESVP